MIRTHYAVEKSIRSAGIPAAFLPGIPACCIEGLQHASATETSLLASVRRQECRRYSRQERLRYDGTARNIRNPGFTFPNAQIQIW